METFSLNNVPESLVGPFYKKTTLNVVMRNTPFYIDTQEGVLLISPETVDDWTEEGYMICYPSDKSKPYAMSVKFFLDNYVKK